MSNLEWPEGAALVGSISRELRHVRLGDRRLDARAVVTGRGLARRPSLSLPESIGVKAAVDGAYDFLSNQRVQFDALLRSHAHETATRVAAEQDVLIVHDTTEFAFSTDRRGLGRLASASSGRRGFIFHCSLALTADARCLPLGVAWANTYVRSEEPKPQRRNGKE